MGATIMKKNVFPREIWLADLKDNENANGMLLKDIHPILILNDFKTLSKQDLIQIVPITSNTERLLRSHLVLEGYGLDKYSKAMFEQIQTISKDQITVKLGKIEDVEMNRAIDNMIKKVILVNSESKLNLDNVITSFNKILEEQQEKEELNEIAGKLKKEFFEGNYKKVNSLATSLIERTNLSGLERKEKNDFCWNAYYAMAYSEYKLGDIQNSIYLTEQSLKFINSIDDKHNYATSIWNLANCYQEINKMEYALVIFNNLSKYYKVNNMKKQRIICIFNSAICTKNICKMQKILNIIEKHKDNVWYTEIDKNYIITEMKDEINKLQKNLI
jgi:mRNA-degrading endonuclease toxin of MazEF toxin-antitoxin module